MRPIDEIIIHCTDTRPEWWAEKPTNAKVAEVRRWHVTPKPEGRGWKDIGYHFLIDRDGTVAAGRPVEQTGAHVMGHNTGTIGISLFGGHDSASTDDFSEHFTPEQDRALRELIADLRQRFPAIRTVSGHNDYAPKACPGFEAGRWFEAGKTPVPDTQPVLSSAAPPGPVRPAPVPPPPSGGFFMRLWRALSGGF